MKNFRFAERPVAVDEKHKAAIQVLKGERKEENSGGDCEAATEVARRRKQGRKTFSTKGSVYLRSKKEGGGCQADSIGTIVDAETGICSSGE